MVLNIFFPRFSMFDEFIFTSVFEILPMKAVLVLCIMKHHTHEQVRENGDIVAYVVKIGTNGSEQSAHHASVSQGKEPPVLYRIGDWVGPKACLDSVEKKVFASAKN